MTTTTPYAGKRRGSWPAISRDLVVLSLFYLFVLTVSLAVFPRLDTDSAEFILKQIQ
jgi:hypothetical protein